MIWVSDSTGLSMISLISPAARSAVASPFRVTEGVLARRVKVLATPAGTSRVALVSAGRVSLASVSMPGPDTISAIELTFAGRDLARARLALAEDLVKPEGGSSSPPYHQQRRQQRQERRPMFRFHDPLPSSYQVMVTVAVAGALVLAPAVPPDAPAYGSTPV